MARVDQKGQDRDCDRGGDAGPRKQPTTNPAVVTLVLVDFHLVLSPRRRLVLVVDMLRVIVLSVRIDREQNNRRCFHDPLHGP